MSLFDELKRRNVFKVAIAYAVTAWLVLQVADVTLNNITAPAWIFRVLLLFLAIGFPIALIFAWAYELTPEGIKREEKVDRSNSITRQTGRRLDFMIIGVLAAAVVLLLTDKFLLTDPAGPTSEARVETDDPATQSPSIAVLPFINLSDNDTSTVFSDGLADTLLHMLAQIKGLDVAARTSSFQYRGQSLDVNKIGKQLGVNAVLEGSVQRSGNTVRVTAQLINVYKGESSAALFYYSVSALLNSATLQTVEIHEFLRSVE